MNMNEFLRTWRGTQAENRWMRIFTLILILANVMLVVQANQQRAIVVLQPPTLSDEARINPNGASAEYMNAWGMYLAMLLGNANPGNTGLIKEVVEPMLAPSIYQLVLNAIDTQVDGLREERASLSFSPRQIEYETESGKVFVTGVSSIHGPSGEPRTRNVVYEFKLGIRNYRPYLEDIDMYKGRPRTLQVLRQEQGKEGATS
ncbi:MAG: TraE/TraK family type IV conjugative transfer system protein [Pseudomonadota bacterium]|nr:TraE/TraK family type IV conjugative transfer system protein [Pseudomonadota bacterium]